MDVEILALRYQITVLQRQLQPQRRWFELTDRALLAAHCTRSRGPCCAGCG